ncbi:MAG: hypothetical protein IJK59_07430 [Firmicutes bacterium]|nr:hypothetical protein [Bacillota bacterium]MBQ6261062.1 hypothetical protein [Bacillota bacterium]MBR0113570.1 hypothetical protein [Bacillota bacterium]MBR0440986.1 hypothetical protein [Bacillota bacterium]
MYAKALISLSDAVIKGKVYECVAEGPGWLRVLDEYAFESEPAGHLFPKRCFEESHGSCPVCGSEIRRDDCFEICRRCGWEDDPLNRDDPGYDGINPMSLDQARKAWAEGKRIRPGYPNPKEGRKIKRLRPV